MAFFDFFKNFIKKKENAQYVSMLNSNYPIFSQFGNDIYASDVVQQALYSIVCEMKKLNPRHVRIDNFDYVPVWDDIQRVLDDPNEIMTKSDFIEKITWQVLLNYNAFIYKQTDENGNLIALYPLAPTQVSFIESGGKIWIQMLFGNGETYTFPKTSIIHIKTHYSVNDLMGGGADGQPDNAALLETLSLNDILLKGVKKSLSASFAINAVVQYNTMLDEEKMQAKIAEFETKLANSKSGILGIDNKSTVTQFKRDLALVDEKTLAFVDDKILRQFGVPLAIIRGDYTVDQYQAFYQKTLEPLIINFSEAFSKDLFTRREKQGYQNKIVFYPKELIFMSTAQTLEMVRILGDKGALYDNEARVAFGLEPLEELRGRRTMSLNYIDAKDASNYQVGTGGDDT